MYLAFFCVFYLSSTIKLCYITLIPGDGVGPEVTSATVKLIEAAGVKISWDIQDAGGVFFEKYGTPLQQSVIDSIKRTGVALKGPIATSVGDGFRSVNVTLRKELDVYSKVGCAHNPIKTQKQ